LKRFVFLLSTSLCAAPIGNPASPTLIQEGVFIADTFWCQPRISFLENFTLDQQLCYSVPATSISSLGVITWSIRERLDLSIILGSGEQYFRIYKNNHFLEFRLNDGLIWYGESKLILLEIKDTILSVFGEAGGSNWMKGPAYIDERPQKEAHLKMRFWQAGVALTQQVGHFCPYIGIVILRSRWKITPHVLRLHQKHTAGPFLGCTIGNTSKFALNIEWRGMVENAYTVSGEIRF
jgi:hypothetical protein